MGYRGFLKPRPNPLTIVRGLWAFLGELWAAKTIASRAVIGSFLGLMLGAYGSLLTWWLCKEPFPLTGVSHQDLWEAVSLPQLFFWGDRWWDADHYPIGDVCLLLATNGLFLGLFGGLIGWYVGRLRKLRRKIFASSEEGAIPVTPMRIYWATIWHQAIWGFCVGLVLSGAAFGFLLFNQNTIGGENSLGFHMMFIGPSAALLYALGIEPPRLAGYYYGSSVLEVLVTSGINGTLLGVLCAVVAALMGPPRAPVKS